MKILLPLFLSLMIFAKGFAGNNDKIKAALKSISGKVMDASGEIIPAAQLKILETNETFYADINGNFSLQIERDKHYTLIVSVIGYVPLEINSRELSNFSELNLTEL